MQVAFYKGPGGLFDRVTRLWLMGKYSHCEIVLAYKDGRAVCVSSSLPDGGVRVKDIALDPGHWDVIEVAGDLAYARQWMDEHAGQGYDVLGLVGFVARVLGHDKRRWLCSEAVAAMLGIPEPWRFDPCSLHAALTRTQPAQAGFFTPEGKA